jgi:acyl carrier protein
MSTRDTVRRLISTTVTSEGPPGGLTDDYPLIEGHVIDSLDMLKLIPLLEEEFGVEVDDEELVPDNFGTITAIASFIEAKRAV